MNMNMNMETNISMDKYAGLTPDDIKYMSAAEKMTMYMHKYGGMSDMEIIADLEKMGDTNQFKVWFMRTMPGRTGNFIGHFIPAFFFFTLAMVILMVSLKRANNIPPGKTFAQLHIPERDPGWLYTFGVFGMATTSFGIIFEAIGSIVEVGNPFHQLAHETLYLSYWMAALCGYLESKGRLPPDSHRGASVVALIASYLMWYSHGTMKLLKGDQTIHILLAYINLSNAAVLAYSMRFTDSVIAFVAGYALLILQAIWLLTAGLYESVINLPGHEIATYLAVQCVLVTLGVIVVVALWGPGVSDQDNARYRGNFSPLKNAPDNDDDEEEAYMSSIGHGHGA